jgi:transposase
VERDLGTGSNVVSKWVREYQSDNADSFPGKGNIKASEVALRDLKKENNLLRRERDILKKAVAIFSKDPNKYMDS